MKPTIYFAFRSIVTATLVALALVFSTAALASSAPLSSACAADAAAREAAFKNATKTTPAVIHSRVADPVALSAKSCLGGLLHLGFGLHLPFGNPMDMLSSLMNKACNAMKSKVYEKMDQANAALFDGTVAQGSGISTGYVGNSKLGNLPVDTSIGGYSGTGYGKDVHDRAKKAKDAIENAAKHGIDYKQIFD